MTKEHITAAAIPSLTTSVISPGIGNLKTIAVIMIVFATQENHTIPSVVAKSFSPINDLSRAWTLLLLGFAVVATNEKHIVVAMILRPALPLRKGSRFIAKPVGANSINKKTNTKKLNEFIVDFKNRVVSL